jgi:hypothetical protein
LPPEIPLIIKYVEVRSKHPDVHKALRVVAALISVALLELISVLKKLGFFLTSFASGQLAHLATCCAVGIWEDGRKAWYSDIVGVEVELGIGIPNVCFRRELAFVKYFCFCYEHSVIYLTMLIIKNLGVTIEEHIEDPCRRASFGLATPRFLIPLWIAGVAVLVTRFAAKRSTEQSESSFIIAKLWSWRLERLTYYLYRLRVGQLLFTVSRV